MSRLTAIDNTFPVKVELLISLSAISETVTWGKKLRV